jgi:hypothetical protein
VIHLDPKNTEKKENYDSGKQTTSITSPDGRYQETGVAKPDDGHVAESRKWSEEHQQ